MKTLGNPKSKGDARTRRRAHEDESKDNKVKQKTLNAEVVAAPRYKHIDTSTGAMILGPVQPDISVREAIAHALRRIGGADGLAEWASLNPNAFYTSVMPKLLPIEITGKDGGPIEFTVVDPTRPEVDITPRAGALAPPATATGAKTPAPAWPFPSDPPVHKKEVRAAATGKEAIDYTYGKPKRKGTK